MDLRTVGDHLKRRRMDLEVQQKQLADELGVKAWNLRLWEAGRSRPAIRYWPAIIHFLGYEPWPETRLLSERLLALRRSRGWSQTRLAEELGTIQCVVAAWETDEHKPTAQFRRRIEGLVADEASGQAPVQLPGKL